MRVDIEAKKRSENTKGPLLTLEDLLGEKPVVGVS